MLSDSLKLLVDSSSSNLKLSVNMNDSLSTVSDSVPVANDSILWRDFVKELFCINSTGTEFKELVFPDTRFRWLFLVIIFGILLLCFLREMIRGKSRLIAFVSNNLLLLSGLIWLLGSCLYLFGFFKPSLPWLAVIPRAIISSFKMFTLGHDLARVHSELQVNAWYMSIFSVVHFAAAFVTFVFIFKMIGFKLKSSWNIIKCTWNSRLKDKTVHLFWGVNNASCLLAQDIYKEAQKLSRQDVIIMIDIDEDSNDDSKKKATLNRITNTITITESEMQIFEDIHALVDHCYDGPAALTFLGENKNSKKINIFKTLHLRRIGKIVERAGKVNCYFLSNDETQNILGALNMSSDWRIKAKSSERACAYIHARRDANNEVFDHYSQYDSKSERMKFYLLDSAYLSVAPLKDDVRTLPVNSVRVDLKTGFVKSPFTALLVGFGATGQEAFKFLYEYSAFIGPDLRKTPFKCYAIDENMDRIEGLVRMKMPAITEDELSLIKAKVDSKEFWNKIDTIIRDLNYVVIAMNNDSLGLSLAVNLFKYALLHRAKDLPMLKILVRCYENSNVLRMKEVVTNLNKSIDGQNVELQIFGEACKIYACHTIMSYVTLRDAKEFNSVYENSKVSADEQWTENFGQDKVTAFMKKKGVSRYHAIYDINRRIAQNVSNVLHGRTKLLLMGLGESDLSDRFKLFYGYVNSRKNLTTKYKCGDEDAQLLRNMAIVEHERWIAAHKLMGYSYASKTDYVKKYHECMCPFDELDEEIQSYDCNVVDTTIKLAYKKSKKD